ncbi:hypothetical protein H2200_004666 [Cladophialophora chaetospira]|uniref:Uncharacterized protein n=1 Tax=Cladophialophora chaetospira TaxID=386627 RepID=A0AA38XEB7_9EURO|nr:hypothetical protein H2200_004666 [Cladophialophora chaetospira]
MPSITLPNFKLSDVTKSKKPRSMVEGAFNELHQWFAGLLDPIQTEYQRGMTNDKSRTDTMLRLSKLAGQVTSMKDLIEGYVNLDLNPKPRIELPDYDLPSNATTLNDAKTPEKDRLKAPVMIAKAFEAMNPWFQSFIPRIRPYYLQGVSDGDEPVNTTIRIGGFVRQVNTLKLLLLNFVNEEIEKKEKGTTSLSADDSAEEVPIPADVGVEIVTDVLDLKISDEPLPPVDDNPKFELGNPDEE